MVHRIADALLSGTPPDALDESDRQIIAQACLAPSRNGHLTVEHGKGLVFSWRFCIMERVHSNVPLNGLWSMRKNATGVLNDKQNAFARI